MPRWQKIIIRSIDRNTEFYHSKNWNKGLLSLTEQSFVSIFAVGFPLKLYHSGGVGSSSTENVSTKQYRKVQNRDETIVKSSYLHNVFSCTGNPMDTWRTNVIIKSKRRLTSFYVIMTLLLRYYICTTSLLYHEYQLNILLLSSLSLLLSLLLSSPTYCKDWVTSMAITSLWAVLLPIAN